MKNIGNPNDFVDEMFKWSQKIQGVARSVMDLGDVPANMSVVAGEWLEMAQKLSAAYPEGKEANAGVETTKKELTPNEFLRYAVAELEALSKEDKASACLRRLAALKHAVSLARAAFGDAVEKATVDVRNDVTTTEATDSTITPDQLQQLNKSLDGVRVAALGQEQMEWPYDMNARGSAVDFGRDPA